MVSDYFSSIRRASFHGGRLLLPLPDAWFVPDAMNLECQGVRLSVKREFHVTLLDEALGSRVLAEVGDARIQRHMERLDWAIGRTGDGAVLRKDKMKFGRLTECASVIEHVALPALNRFRESLGRDAGIEMPETPAHVTLYAGGDDAGIGLPTLQALRESAVATLRLPCIANRSAPPLSEQQRATYCAADYALDALGTSVHIGAHCPIIDAELARRSVGRAAVVTAFNPFSAQAAEVGNVLRQQWLLATLQNEGLQVVEAEGRDPAGSWSPEPSVLVFGTTPQLEERLLRDFEQHALVVMERGGPARLKLHPDNDRRT